MDHKEAGDGREADMDEHSLTQSPVPETEAPPHGEREADAGSQAGDRKPGTPKVEVAEGMLLTGVESMNPYTSVCPSSDLMHVVCFLLIVENKQ